MIEAARIHAFAYRPSTSELRRQLSALASSLVAQFAKLRTLPTPERCERLALNLEGGRQHVLLLREALQRDRNSAHAAQ
jgi:hypothetical protein